MLDFLVNWITNVPVTAAPYALAALGLIISERSGVLNLTAEGLMLVGALAGVASWGLVGQWWGIAVGALTAVVVHRLVSRLVATAPVLEPMVQAWLDRWGEIVLHDPAALLIAAGDGPELGRFERRRLLVEPDGRLVDGGRGASGTVHDVVTSLFGVAVTASVLALLADLKLNA